MKAIMNAVLPLVFRKDRDHKDKEEEEKEEEKRRRIENQRGRRSRK